MTMRILIAVITLLVSLSVSSGPPIRWGPGGDAYLLGSGTLKKADGTEFATSAGGNSFETWDTPAGTDPVADSSTDTLTITSGNTTITITGTSGTDTIDFSVNSAILNAFTANNFYMKDEFDSSVALWTDSSSGASAGATFGNHSVSTNLHPSTAQISTGTEATGHGAIRRGNVWLANGQIIYEADVRTTSLSTAGEEFDIQVGLCDDPSALNCSGFYFTYDRNVSLNWIMTARHSSATDTATSTVVAQNTWYKLRIVVNAAGTSAEYFIDGSSVGTVSTNIPDGSYGFFPFLMITKSAGTTARVFHVDYVEVLANLTSGR